jgi:hypothetical protein
MRAPRVGSLFYSALCGSFFLRLEDPRHFECCRVDANYAAAPCTKRTSATCACTGATSAKVARWHHTLTPFTRPHCRRVACPAIWRKAGARPEGGHTYAGSRRVAPRITGQTARLQATAGQRQYGQTPSTDRHHAPSRNAAGMMRGFLRLAEFVHRFHAGIWSAVLCCFSRFH